MHTLRTLAGVLSCVRNAHLKLAAVDQVSYSRGQLATAVNASALLGWCATEVVLFKGALLPFSLIFGMPIAFILCWSVAAPILRRVMLRPVTWLRAVVWGAGIAAIFVSLAVSPFAIASLRDLVEPIGGAQLGYGDLSRMSDGVLTPYGWWLLAQSAAQFILAGVAVALIIRAKLGPGIEQP